MRRGLFATCVLAVGIGFLARAADESPPPAANETSVAPAAEAVPPPAAPAQKSAAELEKLVEPIAIWPDPLLASALPASVYPLEIVQAARFMADPKNADKLDEQPWDENVKAVARVPEALKQLNDNLEWTMQLGEAFLNQDKELMDAIQSLRMKAQKAGTIQTTEQQVVIVTNTVVETVVQEKPVIVTNTVVQIVPTNPEIVYVPQYVPSAVYYPPPAYVYDPYAPLVTFGAGVAVGVILANGCDWYHGGCYHGGYYGGHYHGGDYKHKTKVKIEGDVNIGSGNVGSGNIGSGNRPTQQGGQKWKPDQSRLGSSGARGTGASTREARGWGGGTPSTRPSTGTGVSGARHGTGAVGTRPSTGTGVSRPGAGTTPSTRPTAGTTPRVGTSPSSGAQRPSATTPSARPSTPSSAPRSTTSQSVSRPSTSQSSAFKSSGSGTATRSASSRGSTSRASSGARAGGGGRGGGGGGRR